MALDRLAGALGLALIVADQAGEIDLLALAGRGDHGRIAAQLLGHLAGHALDLAAKIATRSPIALRLAKEAVNAAYEMSLTDALAYERRLFYLLFASEDQKEGMSAFLEKREPDFKGR